MTPFSWKFAHPIDKKRFTLQDAGRRVVEAMYPHEATAGFTLNIWHNPRDVSRRNTATMEALLSGDAYRDPVWRDLVAGSRAEGLGLEEGWGHEPADNDIMSLHGQSWGVHIPDDKDASLINDAEPTESEGESFLEMVDAETPCFCRLKSMAACRIWWTELARE